MIHLMRSWWFAVACVACGGGGSGGDGGNAIGAVYNVELVAGSDQFSQCDPVSAPFFSSARTIAISGSDVVVSGSALAIPATAASDVVRSGSDLSFFVQWQTGSGSGHTAANESYELSADATLLSGSAQGTYDTESTFICALSFVVTTTSVGSGQ